MIKIPVYLRDMYDAKHLVQAASGCRKDVELGAEEEDVKELREKLENLNLIRE